ncbi:MAG: hypothetical protein K0S33_3742 [Bacteroidetes bacterium]|jgi:hypothetical protein|nr:hypothetical protein [Bacteroidota bacterium]
MKTIYIILTFCVGLFAGYLLFNQSAAPIAAHTITSVAAQEADAIDGNKLKADSILKKRSDLLGGQLLIINEQLKQSKISLASERKKVAALQKTLLQDTAACPDRITMDNLALAIDTLNAVTDTLISDYEQKLQVDKEVIAVRDSQLVVCNQSYEQVQSLIQQQIQREQELTDQLNIAVKQQRKKRIQNRLLAGGVVFLSGLTTTLLIRSKH